MKTGGSGQRTEELMRLGELLLRQRDALLRYRDLLRQEWISIQAGDVDKLQSQLEAENGLISEVNGIRAAVEPLMKTGRDSEDGALRSLNEEVARLGAELKEQNAANRTALKERMEKLSAQIAGMKGWPRPAASPAAAPTLIDISA